MEKAAYMLYFQNIPEDKGGNLKYLFFTALAEVTQLNEEQLS